MKLKIDLSHGERTTLSTQLIWYVEGQQEGNLKAYPAEFLIISTLYDLQQRISRKATAIRVFGPDRRRNGVKLTLSRNEALALYCFADSLYAAGPGLQVASFEGNLLQRLQSQIHQTYLA